MRNTPEDLETARRFAVGDCCLVGDRRGVVIHIVLPSLPDPISARVQFSDGSKITVPVDDLEPFEFRYYDAVTSRDLEELRACSDCGAVVAQDSISTHNEWHDRGDLPSGENGPGLTTPSAPDGGEARAPGGIPGTFDQLYEDYRTEFEHTSAGDRHLPTIELARTFLEAIAEDDSTDLERSPHLRELRTAVRIFLGLPIEIG